MSEDRPDTYDDALTTYSVDDEDQLQPEDTLDDEDVDDVLDRGFSPSDRAVGSRAHGTTAFEEHHHESLDERLLQEEPEGGREAADPDRLGGDDPDAIDALDDWLGDAEVGDARAGRLVADDEGAHEDEESQVWARDVGVDGAAASAEEAAMHVIDESSGRD